MPASFWFLLRKYISQTSVAIRFSSVSPDGVNDHVNSFLWIGQILVTDFVLAFWFSFFPNYTLLLLQVYVRTRFLHWCFSFSLFLRRFLLFLTATCFSVWLQRFLLGDFLWRLFLTVFSIFFSTSSIASAGCSVSLSWRLRFFLQLLPLWLPVASFFQVLLFATCRRD